MPSTQILHTPHQRLASDRHRAHCVGVGGVEAVCAATAVWDQTVPWLAFIQSCSFPYGNLWDAFQPVFKQFSAELHPLKLCLGVSFHHWVRPAQLVIHRCPHYGQFSVYWNSASGLDEHPLELEGQCVNGASLPQPINSSPQCLCCSTTMHGGPQAWPREERAAGGRDQGRQKCPGMWFGLC